MAQNTNQRRAADAVAKWLAANDKNPSWLVEQTKADPGTIGDFLNYSRWPKLGTQGKIEKALGWPAGTIRQIGNGTDVDMAALIHDEVPARQAPQIDVAYPQPSLVVVYDRAEYWSFEDRGLGARVEVVGVGPDGEPSALSDAVIERALIAASQTARHQNMVAARHGIPRRSLADRPQDAAGEENQDPGGREPS